MDSFKFPVINPLLHTDLRLKIMVALDSLESADFVYLCRITDSTRGNLSVQISKLTEAGYIIVRKEFSGKKPLTTCEQTPLGRDSFRQYVELLNSILTGN